MRERATRKRRGEELGLQAGEPGIARVKILDLHRALNALGEEDGSLAHIVEMSYFAGMTAEEIAEPARQSVQVVRHDLRFAQAWLRRSLQDRSLRRSRQDRSLRRSLQDRSRSM
jgi:hypothetical protein